MSQIFLQKLRLAKTNNPLGSTFQKGKKSKLFQTSSRIYEEMGDLPDINITGRCVLHTQ